MTNSKIFNFQPRFRPAQIKKGKELLVEFHCKNPFTNQLKRYRIRLNHLKMCESDKITYAESIVMDINTKLQAGWSPEVDDLNTNFRFKTTSEAFQDFLDVKKSEDLRPDTLRTYTSLINILSNFLEKKYKRKIFIEQINKEVAGEFAYYLTNERKTSARTFNNYINGLKTLFDYLVDHGYKTTNPFKSIHLKRENIKRRLYINDDERKQILSYLLDTNRDYCRIMLMSFFTLVRRTEITKLKVRDVDLNRSLLFVPAEISKNRKDYQVTIPPTMIKWLQELNLSQQNPDHYLFSENYKCGAVQLKSKKISDEWDKLRKALGLSNRLQFMSLRDSGIKKLVQSMIPLDDVMNHARHWSLEVTKTYLIHDTDQSIASIKNANIDF